jgi:opacity protein-like surface antigen
MKRKLACFALASSFALAAAAPAFAEPSPPTNGGNGAGQSGQCTGPQADRPASCQSQGGPG